MPGKYSTVHIYIDSNTIGGSASLTAQTVYGAIANTFNTYAQGYYGTQPSYDVTWTTSGPPTPSTESSNPTYYVTASSAPANNPQAEGYTAVQGDSHYDLLNATTTLNTDQLSTANQSNNYSYLNDLTLHEGSAVSGGLGDCNGSACSASIMCNTGCTPPSSIQSSDTYWSGQYENGPPPPLE